MEKKKKCVKCNLEIDEDLNQCPYCGYVQPLETETKEEKAPTTNIEIGKPIQNNTKTAVRFFDRINIKRLVIFLFSIIGIDILTYSVQSILMATNIIINNPIMPSTFEEIFELLNNYKFTILDVSIIQFVVQSIELAILFLILNKDIPVLFEKAKWSSLWKGLIYGVIGIVFQLVYFNIINAILPSGNQDNINQATLNELFKFTPILSTIFVVILGPICEEIIYRFALFGLLKKKSRFLAYFITGVVFGLIHFNLPSATNGTINMDNLIIELANLPAYIVGGLILAHAYDKHGLLTSTIAHMSINLYSATIIIIMNVLNTGA